MTDDGPEFDELGPGENLVAARSGDQLTALLVLRDTLAHQLDITKAAIHAQLAGQYRDTLAAIDAIKPAQAKSATERLADRVAAANVAS